MRRLDDHRQEQRSTTLIALLLFSLLIVLCQIWLCFGVVENLVAGKPAMAIPAAIASLIGFAIQVWMYVGMTRVEREL